MSFTVVTLTGGMYSKSKQGLHVRVSRHYKCFGEEQNVIHPETTQFNLIR